jgi:hypothetical protein
MLHQTRTRVRSRPPWSLRGIVRSPRRSWGYICSGVPTKQSPSTIQLARVFTTIRKTLYGKVSARRLLRGYSNEQLGWLETHILLSLAMTRKENLKLWQIEIAQ